MQKPYHLRGKKGKTGLGAGVWNIGIGTDPFGGPTREPIPMLDRLAVLADAGMTYFEAHDVEIPLEQAEAARQRADQVRAALRPGPALRLHRTAEGLGPPGGVAGRRVRMHRGVRKAPRTDDAKDITDVITGAPKPGLALGKGVGGGPGCDPASPGRKAQHGAGGPSGPMPLRTPLLRFNK